MVLVERGKQKQSKQRKREQLESTTELKALFCLHISHR